MEGTAAIDDRLREAVASGVFPGASLLVARKGEIIHRGFCGHATLLPSPEPVTEETLWDIASLTKPMATAGIIHEAVREGGMSLDAAMGPFTVRDLLAHTSGLPAWKPYYEDISREHPEAVGKRESRRYYWEKIMKEPLEAEAGQKKIYSDLGFILLGIHLEDSFGKSLDELFREKIGGPLGLRDTFYSPVGTGLPRPYAQFAATENSNWRKKLIRGEVHDDNAYTLGGVAGHAGLFSTVNDLHKFLSAWKVKLTSEESRLGWDRPEEKGSQAGRYFSKNTIGHLGFTGCSFWMDLEQDCHVVLLTNRVHPTSKNERIKEFRPKIHDWIYESLIKR